MRGTAGRICGPSDQGPSHTRLLVESAGTRTRAPVARDSWSTLWSLGPMHEWPRRNGRACGSSKTGRSHPGELVNTRTLSHGLSCLGRLVDLTGLRARARDSRDSLSTPQALGRGSLSPGTSARPYGPKDLSASHQGKMIDTEGFWDRAPVARDSWLTPWTLERRPKTCGTAG